MCTGPQSSTQYPEAKNLWPFLQLTRGTGNSDPLGQMKATLKTGLQGLKMPEGIKKKILYLRYIMINVESIKCRHAHLHIMITSVTASMSHTRVSGLNTRSGSWLQLPTNENNGKHLRYLCCITRVGDLDCNPSSQVWPLPSLQLFWNLMNQ